MLRLNLRGLLFFLRLRLVLLRLRRRAWRRSQGLAVVRRGTRTRLGLLGRRRRWRRLPIRVCSVFTWMLGNWKSYFMTFYFLIYVVRVRGFRSWIEMELKG